MGVPAAQGMGVMKVQKFEVFIRHADCREGCPSWAYVGTPHSPRIHPHIAGSLAAGR